jgi:ribosomal protein S12 methylthiotransferase
MLIQMDVSLENNRAMIGRTFKTFVDGTEEAGVYVGRTEYDAPEIDNAIVFTAPQPLITGTFVSVHVTDAMDYDLVGEIV